MKSRNCPNKDMCWDYNASNCDGCAIGEKVDRFARQNKKLKAENAALRERLKKAVEDVAERIKMAFYYEIDGLIPSIMADKIDEIVKEVLNEHEIRKPKGKEILS